MKKTFLKKVIPFAVLSLIACSSACLAAACSSDSDKEKQQVSGLIGRFSDSATQSVYLTNEKEKEGTLKEVYNSETGETFTFPYLYTSNVYPLNTIAEEGDVNYKSSQTLRLKRDYTYQYDYEIVINKKFESSNKDVAKIEVTVNGTFEYLEGESDYEGTQYTVTLSAPVSGEKVIYGANIALEGSLSAWTISGTESYRLNLEGAADDENFEWDKFTKGRTVSVVKGLENKIDDGIFFTDVLEEIAPYCSYTTSVDGQTSQRPAEPEEPDEPISQIVDLRTVLRLASLGVVEVGIRVADTAYLTVIADEKITEIQINGNAVKGETVNGSRVFELPLGYKNLTEEYTVICGRRGITLNPAKTLYEIAERDIVASDADIALQSLSEKIYAINLLNTAKYFGADVTLSEEMKQALYTSGINNYYNVDWHWDDGRDSLQTKDGSSDAEFAWGTLPELSFENSVELAFPFTVTSGFYQNLKAVITHGGRKYTVPVEMIFEEGGKIAYRAVTDVISPADYDGEITVTVYDGNERISSTAYSSVMRIIAHNDNFATDEDTIAAGNLFYSLGKAAYWHMNRNGAVYEYRHVSVSGTYSLALGKYNYENLLTVSAPLISAGTSLYAGGTVTNNTQADSEGAGFTVSKRGNMFSVMLGGASIDGIRTEGAAELVKINVNSSSQIKNVLVSGDIKSSVIVSGDLTITGKAGAVLDIYGGIFVSGNLNIENVTVRIHGSASVQNAIRVGGNVVISGNVIIENCSTGIYLTGDASQTLRVLGGGLKVSAIEYGITGSRPEVTGELAPNTEVKTDGGKTYANRWLIFEEGEIELSANNGLKYANVRLDKALLTIIAHNGYTVDGEEIPVTLETVSGNYREGRLTLTNNTVINPFWDVYYTVKVKNMLVNGGEILVEGTCRGGVLHLAAEARMQVENCNFTVKNLQENLKESQSAGINLSNSAVVEVMNSAKLIFKDCFTAVNSWLGPIPAEEYGKLINRGIVILDGYKLSLGWDGTNDNVLAWEMQFVYEQFDGGLVKATNRI